MIEFLKRLIHNLLEPTIRETETHYLIELYSDDGFCNMWIEKENIKCKKDL